MTNYIQAGRIIGSPLEGLCERACIEVKKIFDGCIRRVQNANFTVTLTDFSPGAVAPFTFKSASGYGEIPFVISSIIPIKDNEFRVTGTITVPIVVMFTDANNVDGSANASITFNESAVLKLPNESLLPYRIEAFAQLISTVGAFLSDDVVNFSCCYIIIIRVTALVDMVVPTYGYCRYPSCGAGVDICANLFNLPLFPSILPPFV